MSFIKDVCCLNALSVLAACPIPSSISSMTEDQFVNFIRNNHHGLLKKKKLRDLYRVAGTSVGIDVDAKKCLPGDRLSGRETQTH